MARQYVSGAWFGGVVAETGTRQYVGNAGVVDEAGATAYAQILTISTGSSVSLVRAVTHAVAVSSASALTLVRQVGKTAALTTSGTLSALKQVGKPLSLTTASALSLLTAVGRTALVSIASAGSLSLVKQVGKRLTWTTSGALSALGAKVRLVLVTLTTTSALSLTRQAGKSLAWTSSSALSLQRAIAQTTRLAGSSVVSLTRGVSKVLAFTTGAALSLVKQIGKRLAWTTSSTLSTIRGLIRTCLVVIASTSALAITTREFAQVIRAAIDLAGRAAGMVLHGFVSLLSLTSRVRRLELNGMSIEQDGVFHAGESWIITGTARDKDGSLLDLTGGTVQLRIVSSDPNALALDLSTPNTGSITAPATAGQYVFVISPAQQAAMTLSAYGYEVRVTQANGLVSVQNTGEITVVPSKFVNFP